MSRGIVTVALSSALLGAASADQLFGVGVHLGGQKGTAAGTLRMLEDLRASSFRDDVYWRLVEPRKGEFFWPRSLAELDRLVEWSVQPGIVPLLILDYDNAVHFTGLPVEESKVEAFRRYAENVAKRFVGKVSLFELWNEWNLWKDIKDPTESARAYARLLSAVAPTVRAANPQARVICGAVANRDELWIEAFVADPAAGMCDGFSVHPYNFTAPDASAEDVVDWLDRLRVRLARHSKRLADHVYVTEIGWPNHDGPGGSSEEDAASRLLKLFALAKARPWVKGLWWYNLVDNGPDARDKEHRFGLATQSLAPKRTFAAFGTFAEMLKEAKFHGVRRDADGFQEVRFLTRSGLSVALVWRAERSGEGRIRIDSDVREIDYRDRSSKVVRQGSVLTVGQHPRVLSSSGEVRLTRLE